MVVSLATLGVTVGMIWPQLNEIRANQRAAELADVAARPGIEVEYLEVQADALTTLFGKAISLNPEVEFQPTYKRASELQTEVAAFLDAFQRSDETCAGYEAATGWSPEQFEALTEAFESGRCELVGVSFLLITATGARPVSQGVLRADLASSDHVARLSPLYQGVYCGPPDCPAGNDATPPEWVAVEYQLPSLSPGEGILVPLRVLAGPRDGQGFALEDAFVVGPEIDPVSVEYIDLADDSAAQSVPVREPFDTYSVVNYGIAEHG